MILPAVEARAVAGGRKTMHAIPFREDPTVARRLVVGNSLPVRPKGTRNGRAVTLGALCRVVLTEVTWRALGDVGFDEARAMGFRTTDEMRVAWVERYEPRRWEVMVEMGAAEHEAAALDRFLARHATRLVWLLRFSIDTEQPRRLLAARSDELYTENPARALGGDADAGEAIDALTLEEYATANNDRHALRRAGVADELLSEERAQHERLRDAVRLAAERGIDVRDDLRVIERRLQAIRRKLDGQRKAA